MPEVSGLILAGGQGSRMQGADKGWMPWRGQPLIAHVIARLRPQTAKLLISANRNQQRYAALDARVVGDASDTEPYSGPLAGVLAGLRACETDWLAIVPCDAPALPLDLVERLADGRGPAAAAYATTQMRAQPLFCLLSTALAEHLARAMAAGERSALRWLRSLGAVAVRFDDAAAFANLNTPDDLQLTDERR